MVDGNRELIAGLNDDPQFGMTVMVGIGGILAEAIRDVSFRLAPITEVDAAEMLDDLATQRLFGEFAASRRPTGPPSSKLSSPWPASAPKSRASAQPTSTP